MIVSLLYVILAIFGLSILIFIHELGHYFMARHVGMRVETFAIGFGKPIYSWERDGVKWQIGWLLFGGYVKITGQDTDDKRDPYEIPDGFFGKPPIDRIKVAVAGPFVNIVFAFLVFIMLWAIGGREKNFADFTHKIGWIDPNSELYVEGIRPGDEISAYNEQPFQGSKDHMYAPMTSSGSVDIKGNRVDYSTGKKEPFELSVKTYPHPNVVDKGVVTTGIINSANYIIYNRLGNQENPLPEGSPMKQSGIQYGDRVLWVDGDLVFSSQQLNHLLNDHRVFITISRNGEILQMRVPRIEVQEFKMEPQFKEEITDWQYEAGLNNIKLQKLYVIPYNLTNDAIVESTLKFIDKDNEASEFPKHLYSANEQPLQPGDKILAVDGSPVKTSYELLNLLQQHRVNIIVERSNAISEKHSWKVSDSDFDQLLDAHSINQIAQSIGTATPVTHVGNYYLLNAIVPKMITEFELSPDKQAWLTTELQEKQNEIERIEDSEKRTHALAALQNQQKQLLLGLPAVQDRKVNYNPSPLAQFDNVFSEIWRTLTALITGSLNPKWMSGPIGIIQVVHDTSMLSIKEALFWLGAISLNLGILNLLPIPVLDGGTILLSFVEMVSRKRIPPKTLEKVILPFAFLLIAFFVFLTYQDVTRLFSKLFPF